MCVHDASTVSGFQAGLPPPVALSFLVGGVQPTKGPLETWVAKKKSAPAFPQRQRHLWAVSAGYLVRLAPGHSSCGGPCIRLRPALPAHSCVCKEDSGFPGPALAQL